MGVALTRKAGLNGRVRFVFCGMRAERRDIAAQPQQLVAIEFLEQQVELAELGVFDQSFRGVGGQLPVIWGTFWQTDSMKGWIMNE